MARDSANVALVLQGPGIRWRAVDWACAHARQAGQRSLPVVLACRFWWRLTEFDAIAVSDTEAAWAAMPEVVHDAVTERIWGWGLEPVICRSAGRSVAQVISGWAVRPDLLVAARPGPLSWLSLRVVRGLLRRGLRVALIP
jgi:hypothetical protein